MIMNDNLIFHIGLHKTGTTYLQSHLFKKLDVNSENVFSITSSGKIRLVRQRLDSYFTID